MLPLPLLLVLGLPSYVLSASSDLLWICYSIVAHSFALSVPKYSSFLLVSDLAFLSTPRPGSVSWILYPRILYLSCIWVYPLTWMSWATQELSLYPVCVYISKPRIQSFFIHLHMLTNNSVNQEKYPRESQIRSTIYNTSILLVTALELCKM